VLIEYERKARDFLVEREPEGSARPRQPGLRHPLHGQTISSEETMHLLSSVRMGINLGLIRDVEIPTVNKLFIHTQPAHLQKLRGTSWTRPTATSSAPSQPQVRRRIRIMTILPVEGSIAARSNLFTTSYVFGR
jgi:protein-arginine kinase